MKRDALLKRSSKEPDTIFFCQTLDISVLFTIIKSEAGFYEIKVFRTCFLGSNICQTQTNNAFDASKHYNHFSKFIFKSRKTAQWGENNNHQVSTIKILLIH